jgi:hypothetical protein
MQCTLSLPIRSIGVDPQRPSTRAESNVSELARPELRTPYNRAIWPHMVIEDIGTWNRLPRTLEPISGANLLTGHIHLATLRPKLSNYSVISSQRLMCDGAVMANAILTQIKAT